MSETELWLHSDEMTRQHGLDAAIFAAMPADDLMERVDLDGAKDRPLIVKRVNDLLKSGETTQH